MRIVLIFIYFISLAGVMLAFYGMNYLSGSINTESVLGVGTGNGNPALIVLVFAMPFFLYFIYGTIEFSMRLVIKIANFKTIAVFISSSLLAITLIGFYTRRKAQAFHIEIAGQMETVDQVKHLGLWNTYSNPIFFNPLTFFMLVLICFVIGSVWGLKRIEKN